MIKQFVVCLFIVMGVSGASSAQSLFGDSRDPFPPDKNYDVAHYKISITPDFATRTLTGTTTITAKMLATGDTTTWFHAAGLTFKSIRQNGKELRFSSGKETVQMSLATPSKRNRTETFEFDYSVTNPEKGMYFRAPDSTTTYRRLQLWTQGEDMDNRFWFPCYDFPNDKATSEMVITIPDTLKALSNGQLIKVTPDKKNRTAAWHYRQKLPHSSYLIMAAIGEYEVVRGKAGKIPLEYWVYPDQKADGVRGFKQTAEMLKVFEEFTGVSYPWEKYAQIVIQDFMYGGMENTGATTMNDGSINYDRLDRQDHSSDGLVAHEAAHQWFGNIVTMRDWTHLWLNESFATYLESLYYEKTGRIEDFERDILNNQAAGIRVDRWRGRRPVVSVDSYTENLYPRGASILHMMRFVLGDELFVVALRHYLTKHAYQTVTTQDLITAVEESTGKNLDWFFDQWIFKAGYPEYDISHRFDSLQSTLFISIRQNQEQDSLTGIFRMPMTIHIDNGSGTIIHRVENRSADTTYQIAGVNQLLNFSVDRGNYLLKTKIYDKPFRFWMHQLTTGQSMSDIQEAMDAVADSVHRPDVRMILSRILIDSRYADIRDRAADYLLNDGTSDDLSGIIKQALSDKNSLIRRTAIVYLAELPDKKEAWSLALKQYETDSSAMVLRSAVNSLFKTDSLRALTLFKKELKTKPPVNQLWPTILTNFGRFGKSPVDVEFLEGFTRSTISRDIREAALYAMKELDDKHPLTKKRWLEVIDRDADEILREYLLNDVEDFRSEETAAILRRIVQSDPIPQLRTQARLKLVLMGMSQP